MVKLIEVNPADIETHRSGRRGRVAYPILKQFLEVNKLCVKVDLTGVQQTINSMYSSLRSYIVSHRMAITIFRANGEIHLMRRDMDENGNLIKDWVYPEGELKKISNDDDPSDDDNKVTFEPITPDVVKKRGKANKHKTTK